MSTTELTPDPVGGSSIPLWFEMTAAEGITFTRQLLQSRRSVWMILLTKAAALGIACLAVKFALDGHWIVAVLTAYLAVSTWSQHLTMVWLMRALFGDTTTHAELELDSAGIRGEFAFRSSRGRRYEPQRVNYAWKRLRKVDRLPEYLLFEFRGGSVALIPLRAFATPADAECCDTWAMEGLAQQR